MNKRTIALTDQQYIDIITAIKSGFCHAGREYKPNERIATALTLEANLGMRISDTLQLHYCDIIKDGERHFFAQCSVAHRHATQQHASRFRWVLELVFHSARCHSPRKSEAFCDVGHVPAEVVHVEHVRIRTDQVDDDAELGHSID